MTFVPAPEYTGLILVHFTQECFTVCRSEQKKTKTRVHNALLPQDENVAYDYKEKIVVNYLKSRQEIDDIELIIQVNTLSPFSYYHHHHHHHHHHWWRCCCSDIISMNGKNFQDYADNMFMSCIMKQLEAQLRSIYGILIVIVVLK